MNGWKRYIQKRVNRDKTDFATTARLLGLSCCVKAPALAVAQLLPPWTTMETIINIFFLFSKIVAIILDIPKQNIRALYFYQNRADKKDISDLCQRPIEEQFLVLTL